MDYSIIIPVFERTNILRNCINSILYQSCLPCEIIIIDNNTDYNETFKLSALLNNFKKLTNLEIVLIKSHKNSSSLARNLGAKYANGDLVAFLDSDVVLDINYYKFILEYFHKYSDLIAVQGLDRTLIENQKKFNQLSIPFKFLHFFEQVFETSTLLNRENAYVSSSLAVAHPKVDKDFEIESQWISTCAGVFKRNLFNKYSFPENFVTYSNNEYLLFSYRLYKNNEGRMIYSSKPKYKDVQTSSGRLQIIPLIYQIEVNDLYIFLALFPKNIKNILTFLISRVGHLIYNLLKMIYKKQFSLKMLFHIFNSIIYPFINIRNILNNDLSFYERDFPIH
mgnify:CR=1 FL=1